MSNYDFMIKKIIRFVYLQPEVSVSIEKILRKFKQLNRDDINTVLNKMSENDLLILSPENNLTFTTVGSITDEGTFTTFDNEKTQQFVQPTHVSLTLEGINKALEQHALILKARKELILRPLINSLISGIAGFFLGYLFHLM